MSDYDDYEGLEVYDSPDGGNIDGELDEAALWLQGQGGVLDEDNDSPISRNILEGAMTAADLQLGRISHVEPRIQAGIKALLSGQDISGVSAVDKAAAIQQFTSEIGIAPEVFASRIKLDPSVQVPNYSGDIKTVLSMLQNTSGEYMVRGPGKTLPGNYIDSEKRLEANDDLTTAIGYITELSDLYIDGRTRGSSVEQARRSAVEAGLVSRLRDGVFYDGSKDILPLPNEVGIYGENTRGVTGLVRTQGIYGSIQGTADDRLSSGRFDEYYQTSNAAGEKTRFVRDSNGGKVFKNDVSKEDRTRILKATPSLANSLFAKPKPARGTRFTQEERDKHSRDQKYLLDQAQYKAEFARKVLRQQFPTTRDESAGQINMAGFDRPVGEQEEMQNLRNEAAILGLDWSAGVDLDNVGGVSTSTLSTEDAMKVGIFSSGGVGSDKSGGFGYTQMSDVDRFIEEELNPEVDNVVSLNPKQGTPEWLAQRRGKITASVIKGILLEGGVDDIALQLAKERLGTAEPFEGNADTREGNKGEDKVAASFLAGVGKNFTMGEAHFVSGDPKGLKGFGVSPDGWLINGEGESEGLAEFKLLSGSSMKTAVKDYTNQMQLQMAVTGEKQVHFYALDKHSGEYLHEVVKEDVDLQDKIISAGRQAIDKASKLDHIGVQALSKDIEAKKMGPRAPSRSMTKGQNKSFEVTKGVVENVTAFDPAVANVDTELGAASKTVMAQKLEKLDQAERLKNAVDSAQDVSGMSKIESEQSETRRMKAQAIFSNNNRRAGFEGNQPDSEMAKYYEEAQKKAADATNEATNSVSEFGKATMKAVGILSELGGMVMSGNKSGMDEVRFANEVGMDVRNVRGMRESLEKGMLSDTGINKVISRAGSLVNTFNSELGFASEYTNILEARGVSNLESVRSMDIPRPSELKDMNPQQMVSMVAGLMEGKTQEEKVQIGRIFGMAELASNTASPMAIDAAYDLSINQQNLEATRAGIVDVEQVKRQALEQTGEIGSVGGSIATGSVVAGAIAGSATMGFVGVKAAQMLSRAAPSANAAKMAKSMSVLGKSTPLAMAAGLAPLAIRGLSGVKDDGTVGDSALDIMEFAGYGAALGSVIPGAGTLLGAGFGTALGIGNEVMEYFESDPLPDPNIGEMRQTHGPKDKEKNIVNVEVTNEISRDLIRTTTDVNGDLNVDEESGIGTGDS